MLAIGNSLAYMCPENYQNRAKFDEGIVKMKWCSLLTIVETEISAVLWAHVARKKLCLLIFLQL